MPEQEKLSVLFDEELIYERTRRFSSEHRERSLSQKVKKVLSSFLAGAALFAWAVWQKPRKFTFVYAFFAVCAAAAAYAGGAYIPAPEGADTVTKGFLALSLGLKNMFSSANVIVYALFLYLAASKMVSKDSWTLKALAIAAYLAGLSLTYAYFRAGAEITPEKAWLAAGGALALIGLLAALTQKEFSLLLNPQFLFLAANITMFAMFVALISLAVDIIYSLVDPRVRLQ